MVCKLGLDFLCRCEKDQSDSNSDSESIVYCASVSAAIKILNEQQHALETTAQRGLQRSVFRSTRRIFLRNVHKEKPPCRPALAIRVNELQDDAIFRFSEIHKHSAIIVESPEPRFAWLIKPKLAVKYFFKIWRFLESEGCDAKSVLRWFHVHAANHLVLSCRTEGKALAHALDALMEYAIRGTTGLFPFRLLLENSMFATIKLFKELCSLGSLPQPVLCQHCYGLVWPCWAFYDKQFHKVLSCRVCERSTESSNSVRNRTWRIEGGGEGERIVLVREQYGVAGAVDKNPFLEEGWLNISPISSSFVITEDGQGEEKKSNEVQRSDNKWSDKIIKIPQTVLVEAELCGQLCGQWRKESLYTVPPAVSTACNGEQVVQPPTNCCLTLQNGVCPLVQELIYALPQSAVQDAPPVTDASTKRSSTGIGLSGSNTPVGHEDTNRNQLLDQGGEESLKYLKTRICTQFRLGRCNRSSNVCKFAHSLHELRSTKGLYKTKLCAFWMVGNCKAGDCCRHAHGEHELQRRNSSEKSSPTNSMTASMIQPTGSKSGFDDLGSSSPLRSRSDFYNVHEEYGSQLCDGLPHAYGIESGLVAQGVPVAQYNFLWFQCAERDQR